MLAQLMVCIIKNMALNILTCLQHGENPLYLVQDLVSCGSKVPFNILLYLVFINHIFYCSLSRFILSLVLQQFRLWVESSKQVLFPHLQPHTV